MEKNQTTWQSDRKSASYPPLSKSASTDICVIGAGLTGILCAWRLAEAGKKVIVLEAETIGAGATGMTTAFITQAIDTDPEKLTSMFGQAAAKEVWDSGVSALDEIEKIVKKERLTCEFMRCPAILYPGSAEQKKEIRKYVSALGRLGYKGTMDEDNFILPRQAKFHPLKFLDGLARRAAKARIKIYEKTKAEKIKDDNGSIIISTAGGFEVKAKDVVIATYHPLGNPWDTFLKKGMYVSYVIEINRHRDSRPEGIYWDLSNPYHYYRVDHVGKGEDRVIIGGADTKSIFPVSTEKQFDLVLNHLHEVVGIKEYEFIRRWTGPILEPSDGLPLIGRYKPHHYVATAFSGNGMTYAMLSSIIITDLIFGKENPYTQIYNPERIPSIKALTEKAEDYIEELGTAVIKPRTTKKKLVE